MKPTTERTPEIEQNTPQPVKTVCYGFQWIGQSFAHCDNCGAPYWDHTHMEKGAKRDGTRVTLGRCYRQVISREEAKKVKAKWG